MSNPSTSVTDEALAAIEDRATIDGKLSAAAATHAMGQVWDLASVARAAIRETEHLAEVERTATATAPPRAARRLRLVGDVAAVCLAGIVAGTARTMRADRERPPEQGDR